MASAEGQQSGEHLDDRGFAAAIGAQKPEDFSLFHAEADVVHGGEVAETPDQVLRGDGRLC